MFTDIDWIAEGKPWPPEDADERARLAEHARNRQVYAGLHDVVMPRYAAYLSDQAKDGRKQPIILDWPALATGSYISLLLGEEPEVLAGDRKDLPERSDEQVFIDVSRYGIGLYEVSDSGIQALNPENCYLITTPGNIQRYQAVVFFTKWKETIIVNNEKEEHEYVKFTIHSVGKIQHAVYEIVDKSTLPQLAGIIDNSAGKVLHGPLKLGDFPAYAGLATETAADGSQEPPVDDMLVVVVQNKLTSERYYGQSDYPPAVLTLTEHLERLFSQRAEVLAKFTSPTPVIPESAAVFDHAKQEWVFKPGSAIITQPGDTPPALMVWQAELGAVDRAIEQAMDQLLQMLQLSRVLLAGQGQGAAESGTALRIRLIPTLAKVSRYARAAEMVIPKVLNLWSQLHPPEIPLDKITINMQDGIPEDPMETANLHNIQAAALSTLTMARILSPKAALQAAYDAEIIQPLPDMTVADSIAQISEEAKEQVM